MKCFEYRNTELNSNWNDDYRGEGFLNSVRIRLWDGIFYFEQSISILIDYLKNFSHAQLDFLYMHRARFDTVCISLFFDILFFNYAAPVVCFLPVDD